MGRNSELNLGEPFASAQLEGEISGAEDGDGERKTGFEPATLTLARWCFSSLWSAHFPVVLFFVEPSFPPRLTQSVVSRTALK